MKKIMIALLAVMLVFTGCTTNNQPNNPSKVTDISVDEILTAIKDAYGDDYLPNVEIGAELLELEFGLTSDMIEDVVAEQPMIGVHADRVVVVKAAEGKADDVEVALTNAKDNKINDTLQYPMNLAKINSTKIVRHGDCVVFLLVGAINESESSNEEELMQFAENEVQKGVTAINNLFK